MKPCTNVYQHRIWTSGQTILGSWISYGLGQNNGKITCIYCLEDWGSWMWILGLYSSAFSYRPSIKVFDSEVGKESSFVFWQSSGSNWSLLEESSWINLKKMQEGAFETFGKTLLSKPNGQYEWLSDADLRSRSGGVLKESLITSNEPVWRAIVKPGNSFPPANWPFLKLED